MYAILSWLFVILTPVSFVGILLIAFKKIEGNIIKKLFIGIVVGAIVAFLMWYIGMSIAVRIM
jgi:hypothetical protein